MQEYIWTKMTYVSLLLQFVVGSTLILHKYPRLTHYSCRFYLSHTVSFDYIYWLEYKRSVLRLKCSLGFWQWYRHHIWKNNTNIDCKMNRWMVESTLKSCSTCTKTLINTYLNWIIFHIIAFAGWFQWNYYQAGRFPCLRNAWEGN